MSDPITARTADAPIATIDIVKLAPQGFIAKTGDTHLKVGQEFRISFLVPGTTTKITDDVVVIKTYDRYQEGCLAEVHFKAPSKDGIKAIKAFANKYG